MSFIPFTDEEKDLANRTDLPMFLQSKGAKLKRDGSQYVYIYEDASGVHDSIKIRGSKWYDFSDRHRHKGKNGGGPISFMRAVLGMTYQEAILALLGKSERDYEWKHTTTDASKQRTPKPFALPVANTEMWRSAGYLGTHRHISKAVIRYFADEGLIYEAREPVPGKEGQFFHNLVFVGFDEQNIPRHAHKRSNTPSGSFRMNVEGSDPRYSFHHIGTSDILYVFEAPIDMLSFITLYPKDWQKHSYVALCGVSSHAIHQILDTYPHIKKVALCLDHDAAGIEAIGRISEELSVREGCESRALLSQTKDWNEDIKKSKGLPFQPAEEHPQLVVAPGVFRLLADIQVPQDHLNELPYRISWRLQQIHHCFKWGDIQNALEHTAIAGALAIAGYARESRQMGEHPEAPEIAARLHRRFSPHNNKGRLQHRLDELDTACRQALSLLARTGILNRNEKEAIRDAFEQAAMECAKVVIHQRTEEMLLTQEEEPQPEDEELREPEPSLSMAL